MLDVSYNRRSDALPPIVLLWIGLLTWTISSSWAVDINCCPNNSIRLPATNCTDGTEIRLNCSSPSYWFDSDEEGDNFTIILENDMPWLQLVDIDDEKIPASRFCVTNNTKSGSMVAAICFEGDYDANQRPWRNTLFSILSIISAVFLISTLTVYILLPELREIQDKAMIFLITSLAVSYIILSIQNLRTHLEGDDTICLMLGFILYFGFMCAFFWLNITSFNIWRTVWFKSFVIPDESLFITYCIVGWGGPICLLILSLITHHVEGNHLKPGFGEQSCWFNGSDPTWAYFYGPVAILLTLNIVYLGLTSWRLWHQYRNCSGTKLRVLRFKCLLYTKLIFVMGITWIFEVLSYVDHKSRNNIWILTDILNSLQGFIIFLLLVAMRKRVRKLLAKKKPCGISFPKSWTTYEDEECEEVLPEEVELSQHD